MKNSNFYKVLELLYKDGGAYAKENQSSDIVNALHVYQILEEVMPRLLLGYDQKQGLVVDLLTKELIRKLKSALKKIKVFPEFNLDRLNRQAFFEVGIFLEFVEFFQRQPVIRKSDGNITLFDKVSKCWKLDQQDYAFEFLKAYVDYRYKKQSEQSPSVQEKDVANQLWSLNQDGAIEELDQEIKADLCSLLKKVGMLSFVTTKITIQKNEQDSSHFSKLIEQKHTLLNVLQSDQGVVRILYKLIWESEESLVYFAVFFVRSTLDFNQTLFVRTGATALEEYITQTLKLSVKIKVQNLNSVLNGEFMPLVQSKDFLLVDEVEQSWTYLERNILGFLYQLEKFSEFRKESAKYANFYLSGAVPTNRILQQHRYAKIDLDIRYFKANDVLESTTHLLFFSKAPCSKDIWKIDHLSFHAQEYIIRISILYLENFTVWKIQKYYELARSIEIFMMTLKESVYDAFYTLSTREILKIKLEHRMTRHLLQFAQIFKNLYWLDELQQILKGKAISRTLKHFFLIYAEQCRDQNQSIIFERILAANLNERGIPQQLDKIVSAYRFTQPLFFKAPPRKTNLAIPVEKKRIRLYAQVVTSSPLDHTILPVNSARDMATSRLEKTVHVRQPVQSDDEQAIVSSSSDKLIHIQRHLTRLDKVQKRLKQAVKTDVVIIRCLFCCDSSEMMSYSYFSKTFSTMLQDNKKTRPIGDIVEYLGYWQAQQRTSDNQITHYAANVVLLFKSQVLLEFPDLFAELEHHWRLACQKVERECDPEIRINGYVKKLQIAQTLPQLQRYQLLLETTQKTLARDIVNYLASYTVYQDLLDDEIYQQLPKWLIKKTGTTNKAKAAIKKS
ncbi:MAG: hypothetical protein LKF82_04275 [Acinetobacter populi]|jgi:hypothetical protein|uniref:hypothetical protein n=1 Tax=Acinetobacter populi TaxID=1582270 RepID=UPI00235409A1|nr:hypothetical protein [Acinetobacter populi]MCH4247045.1 hypothetical protein [Acinetobacter populi]